MPGTFPWATFWTNLSGAFVLGVFLTVVIERFPFSAFVSKTITLEPRQAIAKGYDVVVLQEDPDDSLRSQVNDAVKYCPAMALAVEEEQ